VKGRAANTLAHLLGAAVVLVVVLALLSGDALAGSEGPVNDNFLFSINLNAPHTPLNSVATLNDITDTVGATVQQNIFSPCGNGLCPNGPPELSTCDGVSYGKTVWYDFYPDHDGQAEIRTTGIPNVIALYTYRPFSLYPTEIQCEPGSGYPSNELFAYVHAGLDYTFQVGGRNDASGSLEIRFNYAYANRLTVTPFLTAPVFSFVPGNPQATRLVGLDLHGLARGEQLSVHCRGCGGVGFGRQHTHGNAVDLSADSPVALTRRTRITIGASSPAQIGRFKIYAVDPTRLRLSVLTAGCLSPGAASVASPTAPPPPLPNATACPPPELVNPIGAEYVFWQGGRNRLWETWYHAQRWTGPIPVHATNLGSAPAVAIHADGQQDVFWKGTDGNLWETWYTGQWHRSVDLRGGPLGSAPTVGIDSAGDEYVFWQGTGGGLWEKSYSAGNWSQPIQLNAGKLGSGPTVAVHSDGEQDVFWKGTDGGLWETWYSGKWNGPIPLGGGSLGSAPSAAIDGAGDEYVFWRGADGGLWGKTYFNGRWGAASSIRAGQLVSAPTVAVHANGEQDVFWEGTDGDLWENWYTGRWNGPLNLGNGRLGSPPGAGVDNAGKQGTSPSG
jgi:hypothetical protein